MNYFLIYTLLGFSLSQLGCGLALPTIEAETPPQEDNSLLDAGSDFSDEQSNTDEPTWWDCRRAFTSEQLTAEFESTCDVLFLAAPAQRQYGIRWVVLTELENPEEWINEKLEFTNRLYAPANITFFTRSILFVDSPIVDLGVASTERSLEEMSSDIAQYLEIDETDPARIIEELNAQQEATGVHPDAIATMTLSHVLENQPFLQSMARLRPEEIHVMILERVNSANAGGMSSGPGTNPTSPRVSIVNLLGKEDLSPVAFPHELGHYFGLKHPHKQSDGSEILASVDFEEILSQKPFEDDLIQILTNYLGEDFDGDPGHPYLAYNASWNRIQNFTRIRYTLAQLWLTQNYTYRNPSTGPEIFNSLADFIEWGQSGAELYYKNFTSGGSLQEPLNNCSWNTTLDLITCDIGDPTIMIRGDEPFLNNSITLNDGQDCNIMTYIAKALDIPESENHVAFTQEQIRIMHLHTNTAVRQQLRNFLP